MSRKQPKRAPQSDPSPQDPELDPSIEGLPPDNGSVATAEEAEGGAAPEQPAQVSLTIKGSDRSARAAAKRFGGDPAKPSVVETPANDDETPVDPIAELLSDGKNMVLVTRQKPRTVVGPDGSEHATNIRIHGSYTCPTSKAEIEELVFEQHGGSKYKCTIHPDTTDGANKILGHFTIENPDSKCPPYIDGVTINIPQEQEERLDIPNGSDPTARETDPLAQMRTALQRRLERAQMKKEIEELETQVRDIENGGRKPEPSGESDEVRKLREKNADLEKALAEKKVNDRFDGLENSIKTLAAAVTAKPAEKSGDEPVMKFIIEKMKSDDTRFTEMMRALTAKQAPTVPVPSGGEDFDKFLDRFTKLQALTGGGRKSGEGRLSDLEQKLIDVAYDKLMGGDGDGGDVEDTEDVAKLAVKQFAPILKTFVEKKMDQENAANGGAPVTEEQKRRIYAEAAQAAARKVTEDLAAQGISLAQGSDGKLVALPAPATKTPVVPPRQGSGPGKVVDVRRTNAGIVKTVSVEPHSSARPAPQPKESAPATQVPTTNTNTGGDEVKYAEFPGLGQGGGVLRVELPAPPDDVQYDRRRNVNFILDAIRSEILQEIPQKRPDASFVLGDVMELLDDEILDRISRVEDGTQMEGILAEFGDRTKIDEIKKSGESEDVKVWLRRLVTTIGDTYRDQKKAL
jgi:hypothetical protein